MLPDRVSNPVPLTYESGALPTALRGPAILLLWRYYVSHKLAPSCSEMTVGVEKMLYKSQTIIFLVENGQKYF